MIERLIAVGDVITLKLTQLAVAFAIAHPGVTSAIIGRRTMDHLAEVLAGTDVARSDETLDTIDEFVSPGTNVGAPDAAAYVPRSSEPI